MPGPSFNLFYLPSDYSRFPPAIVTPVDPPMEIATGANNDEGISLSDCNDIVAFEEISSRRVRCQGDAVEEQDRRARSRDVSLARREVRDVKGRQRQWP